MPSALPEPHTKREFSQQSNQIRKIQKQLD